MRALPARRRAYLLQRLQEHCRPCGATINSTSSGNVAEECLNHRSYILLLLLLLRLVFLLHRCRCSYYTLAPCHQLWLGLGFWFENVH